MSTKNSNFLGCRVNNERYQEVKALCEEQGRTVNDFLGEIIGNELNGSPDEAIENISMSPVETFDERFENFVSEKENNSLPAETSENQVVSEEENNVSPGEQEEQNEEKPGEPDKQDKEFDYKALLNTGIGVFLGVCLVVSGADLSVFGIKGKFYRGSSGVSGSF